MYALAIGDVLYASELVLTIAGGRLDLILGWRSLSTGGVLYASNLDWTIAGGRSDSILGWRSLYIPCEFAKIGWDPHLVSQTCVV